MVRLFRRLIRRHKKPRVPIDGDIPLRGARYVVMDTELTGLNDKKDSIISIGAVRMNGASISIGDAFYCLARPSNMLSNDSVLVHGITPSELHDKDALESVLTDFLLYSGSDILIGHFLSIDLCFVNKEMMKVFDMPLPHYGADTFVMYRWLLGRGLIRSNNGANPQSLSSLYDIARSMGIIVSGAHNALMDAYITAQLFQHMIPIFEKNRIERLGQLLRVGDPTKGGDKCLINQGELSNL